MGIEFFRHITPQVQTPQTFVQKNKRRVLVATPILVLEARPCALKNPSEAGAIKFQVLSLNVEFTGRRFGEFIYKLDPARILIGKRCLNVAFEGVDHRPIADSTGT